MVPRVNAVYPDQPAPPDRRERRERSEKKEIRVSAAFRVESVK
jgi:hypothetical protein